MNPITWQWFLFLAGMVVFAVGFHLIFRRCSTETKRNALLGYAAFTLFVSTWFTFDRVNNPAYPHFTFVAAGLPLHFCTMASIFAIPALLARRGWWVQPLRALLFYAGSAAALLAMATPAAEYLDKPFFSMNTLFYVIHGGNVLVPILMVSLGFYRPRFHDTWRAVLWFFILAIAVALPAVAILRHFFVNPPRPNYFFFFDPEGAGIFQVLWDLIGIPVVYQIPLLVMIWPVFLLQYGIYRLLSRLFGLPRWAVGDDGIHSPFPSKNYAPVIPADAEGAVFPTVEVG